MKQPTIVPALETLHAAYEKAIDLFPEEKQRNALRKFPPVIVIQQTGRSRRKVYGWHANQRWKKTRGKKEINEITITAEQLNAGYYRVMDTLIHEMVHHVNDLLDVNDVSNGYHNRQFADLAEAVGLVVTQGSYGFAHTEPSEGLKKIVRSWGLDTKVFDMYRVKEKPQRKGSKLKKWACDCGYGIRIAVSPERVDLTCNICGGRVEQLEDY